MSDISLIILLGSIVMLHILGGFAWVMWKIFGKKERKPQEGGDHE